ncbi:MAG: glutathione S-transferase N-terminal domain-containing protein [Gammaproteobacteria bacterium]|nr:glutathione S-transferase N-terminal domain-containing protein [Gammaproteobacteria bacterium]
MIDLYYWPTPNGHKASIMLEEVGLEYELHAINILRGDQFKPEFLAVSPNNKIPAIVDRQGPRGQPYPVFESGAILMYLADKTGRLLPHDTAARYDVVQWLMFQMGSVGPFFGQCGHFKGYAPEPIPYAIDRYYRETLRLYGVLDRRLAAQPYLAGADYSIADVAVYPWTMPVIRALHGVDIDEFAHVRRWGEEIAARPAVQRGTALLADVMKIGDPDEAARAALFGQQQYER